VILEPGIYINLFEIEVPDESINPMVAYRSRFPDLRPLRSTILQKGWNVTHS